jgi:hypothetical protein
MAKKVITLKQIAFTNNSEKTMNWQYRYEVVKLKNTVSFYIGQVLTKDEAHRLTIEANTEIIVSK